MLLFGGGQLVVLRRVAGNRTKLIGDVFTLASGKPFDKGRQTVSRLIAYQEVPVTLLAVSALEKRVPEISHKPLVWRRIPKQKVLMDTERKCPNCGGRLSDSAPAGLCPRRLFETAHSSSEDSVEQRASFAGY